MVFFQATFKAALAMGGFWEVQPAPSGPVSPMRGLDSLKPRGAGDAGTGHLLLPGARRPARLGFPRAWNLASLFPILTLYFLGSPVSGFSFSSWD